MPLDLTLMTVARIPFTSTLSSYAPRLLVAASSGDDVATQEVTWDVELRAVPALQADLEVTPAVAKVGDLVTCRIVLRNSGQVLLHNLRVALKVPNELVVTKTSPVASVSAGEPITWEAPTLPFGLESNQQVAEYTAEFRIIGSRSRPLEFQVAATAMAAGDVSELASAHASAILQVEDVKMTPEPLPKRSPGAWPTPGTNEWTNILKPR